MQKYCIMHWISGDVETRSKRYGSYFITTKETEIFVGIPVPIFYRNDQGISCPIRVDTWFQETKKVLAQFRFLNRVRVGARQSLLTR